MATLDLVRVIGALVVLGLRRVDMTDRQFDLVLFGATGFTGGLVADYLATVAPADLRIALAGRDVAALTGCRDRLPGRAQGWAVLPGASEDSAGLAWLAESTRLVLPRRGPTNGWACRW